MKQIPVTNDGKSPKKVGNRTIMPGATAYFYENELPPHLREPKQEKKAPVKSELELLLEQSIKAVTVLLPGLSDDQLDELKALEDKGQNRKGIDSAITEERLRRANLKTDIDQGADDQNSNDLNDNDRTGDDQDVTE